MVVAGADPDSGSNRRRYRLVAICITVKFSRRTVKPSSAQRLNARLEFFVSHMITLGQIAYEAAALETDCEQPWENANQDKWQAAAEAIWHHLKQRFPEGFDRGCEPGEVCEHCGDYVPKNMIHGCG